MNRQEFDQLSDITERVVIDIKADRDDPYELLTREAAMKKAGKMAILEAQRQGLLREEKPAFEDVTASPNDSATVSPSISVTDMMPAADAVSGGEATVHESILTRISSGDDESFVMASEGS